MITSSPAETIQGAAVALGRSAGAPLACDDRRVDVAGRRRRAVVDEALGRDRCPDSFVDDAYDLEIAVVAAGSG
jgi:hypothetical protein